TPSRAMASRQMVRTSGTVTASRGRRNEYRISTLTPLLTAAGELRCHLTKPLPPLGCSRTWGGRSRQGQGDPEAGRAGPDEVEPAAVGLDQGAGQRQPDAVPAGRADPPLEQPGAR